MKPLEWVGGTRRVVRGFPSAVRQAMGLALFAAQLGDKHVCAKPLKGHKGSGVLEIVDDFDGNTYRAVYTVRMPGVVYALRAFRKRSTKGIATPRRELETVRQRLAAAEAHYRTHYLGRAR